MRAEFCRPATIFHPGWNSSSDTETQNHIWFDLTLNTTSDLTAFLEHKYFLPCSQPTVWSRQSCTTAPLTVSVVTATQLKVKCFVLLIVHTVWCLWDTKCTGKGFIVLSPAHLPWVSSPTRCTGSSLSPCTRSSSPVPCHAMLHSVMNLGALCQVGSCSHCGWYCGNPVTVTALAATGESQVEEFCRENRSWPFSSLDHTLRTTVGLHWTSKTSIVEGVKLVYKEVEV